MGRTARPARVAAARRRRATGRMAVGKIKVFAQPCRVGRTITLLAQKSGANVRSPPNPAIRARAFIATALAQEDAEMARKALGQGYAGHQQSPKDFTRRMWELPFRDAREREEVPSWQEPDHAHQFRRAPTLLPSNAGRSDGIGTPPKRLGRKYANPPTRSAGSSQGVITRNAVERPA